MKRFDRAKKITFSSGITLAALLVKSYIYRVILIELSEIL